MASSPDSRWMDISRPLAPDSACWPGDMPYAYQLGWKMADGASVNVGSITTSVHTATHCDAPFHFQRDGITVDQIPLEVFIGEVWVVDVRGCLNDWMTALASLPDQVSRILFHTGGWPDTRVFPQNIPVLFKLIRLWLRLRPFLSYGLIYGTPS